MEWELQQTRAQAETCLADMQVAQRAYTDVQSARNMMAMQLCAWEQANGALVQQLHEVLQSRDIIKRQNGDLVSEKISVWARLEEAQKDKDALQAMQLSA